MSEDGINAYILYFRVIELSPNSRRHLFQEWPVHWRNKEMIFVIALVDGDDAPIFSEKRSARFEPYLDAVNQAIASGQTYWAVLAYSGSWTMPSRWETS